MSLTTWHSLGFSQAQWEPRFPLSRQSCGAGEDGQTWYLPGDCSIIDSQPLPGSRLPYSPMESFPGV